MVLGGRDSRRAVAGEGARTLAESLKLSELEWRRLGPDWLLEVEAPKELARFIAAEASPELSLIAALTGDRQHPRRHFEWFQREHQRHPKSISVWVGPEGDFTPAEIDAIKEAGWREQHILVVNETDERLDFIEREIVRRIGERLYGRTHHE